MLINLHKKFCFTRGKDVYQVGYVFEKNNAESNGLSRGNVCLTVSFSKNCGDEITDKTTEASSMLSQSNESIQKIIEAKIVSITETAFG